MRFDENVKEDEMGWERQTRFDENELLLWDEMRWNLETWRF